MAFDEAYNEPENVEVLVKSLVLTFRRNCIMPMPVTLALICALRRKSR